MSNVHPLCVYCYKKSGKLNPFDADKLKKCADILKVRKIAGLAFANVVLPENTNGFQMYHSQCHNRFTALPPKHKGYDPKKQASSSSSSDGILGTVRCGAKFPETFKFGSATAAYQVEGAWNVSDKGENIWDNLVHNQPWYIRDGSTGDVACDSYQKWREDVQLAANLGLDFYRFSIAWSRILPTGLVDRVSEDGIRYYSELIDELLKHGIEPVVTLYHWDLPQRLQNLGGWTNPHVVDWFGDYARVVYSNYSDRVKTWITINEPVVVCDVALNTQLMAPGFTDPEFGAYLCNKNILMAHARAWRIYDEEFRPKYHGKVSLSNHLVWYEPLVEGDEEYAELANQFCAGRYSHPVYSSSGGWPPAVEQVLAKKSRQQGHPRSKLPAFTDDEKKYVKGTYDFYGLNFYTSRAVRKMTKDDVVEVSMWPFGSSPDAGVHAERRPHWPLSDSSWLIINPEGFRKMLVWLKNNYGDIEYLITENGFPDVEGSLKDTKRIDYIKQHLEQVQLAIEDGVNVVGYTAWTLIDNFEWMDGYRNTFGLHAVDFSAPDRARTPRQSARYFTDVITQRTWNVSTDTEDYK